MNAFHEHHKDSIRFGYRCFDRLLRNARIQPFQQPERVIGFFNTYREGNRVTRSLLTDVADQFRDWVTNRAHKWGVPILDAPEGRRDDFLDRYFKRVKANEVVAILKAREPARILIANGNKKDDRWYLQITQRWVNHYSIYLNDARWGRIFVRMCPYFPFSAATDGLQRPGLQRVFQWESHSTRIHYQDRQRASAACDHRVRLGLSASALDWRIPSETATRLGLEPGSEGDRLESAMAAAYAL